MIKQEEIQWIREHLFRRTGPASGADRAATVLLVALLPVLAAFIQSSWIWFVRDAEHYQAMLCIG
ncbi:MAG TPA: hypothetical protein VFE51_29890 [Verrucomicrobiae bacterium]|nr:hypothetical protein [Verrucomicrobiae bacterium]